MNNPLTTAELFRLLSLSIGKEKPATAYRVAQVFEVSETAARNWERGFAVMDEMNAAKAAGMLGLELDFVVLSLQAERLNRSKMDIIAGVFERAALASLHHAAALVFSVFLLFSLLAPAPVLAADSVFFGASESILCVFFRRLICSIFRHTHGHGWPRPAAFSIFHAVI